ncbi:MAG: hypothetical protein CM15mV148_170 [uncultured marine virus]|nr:MAG: hypothetical protein CM15mV148_170 [uncultured marine virus]
MLTVSGYTRVSIDTVVKAVDRGIATSLEQGSTEAPNEDIFAFGVWSYQQEESKAITEIFDMGFHNKATQLFRELQDIDPKGASGSAKIEKLRAYGKRTEQAQHPFRQHVQTRAAFVGALKRQLNERYTALEKAGKLAGRTQEDFNLVNIIKEGKFNTIFGDKAGKKALVKPLEDALYFTYQKSPTSPAARAIIQGIHSAPF